jgi:hypothetical protein
MDVGKPVEVLDKMIDLQRWWESDLGHYYGSEYIKSMIEQERYPGFFSPAERFSEHQANSLQRSLAYFVTDQMVDKIWQFSKGFETVGFYPEEVPCDFGFMWLAKPVHVLDARGKIQCQRAITWVKQESGVGLCFYADKHDPLDEVNDALRKEKSKVLPVLPELTLNHVMPVGWGDRTNWFLSDPDEYTRKYKGPLGDEYDPGEILVAAQEQFAFCRFLLACWEWMGYQLPSRALPHRQMAHRLGRSNLNTNEVLVIDLQAIEPSHIPPATHQIVRWHYRWRSRPHKRHWVDKYGNHRTTDVVGCIKGPEGLPLVEKDILFKMRRGHAPV